MLKGSNPRKNANGIRTTLGRETNFKGIMRFDDSLKIEGRFEGEIISNGFLYIEEGAEVKADIKVASLVIGGIVHGNIVAVERLEMLETGRVYGNVKTKLLKIADGVVFDGKCEMIRESDNIDVFSLPVNELKKAVKSI